MRCPERDRFGSDEFDDNQAPLFTNRAGLRVGEMDIGCDVRADESAGLAKGEQRAAVFQLGLPDAIGQESELTDADQTGRQYVKQEAANELGRFQSHGLGPAAISIVLPLEADAAIFQRSQTMAGNRHTVRVTGQILEDSLGSAKGRLNVNDPWDGLGLLAQEAKLARIAQRAEFAMEVEQVSSECRPEGSQEDLPEAAAEHTHRQKEGGLAAGDPAGAVRGDAAARYDAMQVRVQMQILTPGVQHRQKADGGAQQPRVCCRFEQGSGGGVKENVVNRFRIL